jgi:hypothetical protein
MPNGDSESGYYAGATHPRDGMGVDQALYR